MKRKTFEFDDELAAAFEQFCDERKLVEKRVMESLAAFFIEQDAETRESILLSREQPKLRIAAKRAGGIRSRLAKGDGAARTGKKR